MPPTRSQGKKTLQAAARRVEVRVVRRVRDESDLYVFTVGAAANPAVGSAVEHLMVELSNAYSARLLRSALRMAPNVTDLILTLPTPFPLHLLDGVVFSGLVLLKTNLPHNRLVTFLSAHPSVSFLDLGPCGRSHSCPLATVDFSRIHDFHCPVECGIAIVHPGANRFRGDLTRPGTVVSTILRSFPVPYFALHVLCLQFNPTDDDILASIARFVPMVRVLRLWERADYTVLGPHSPRPWLHAPTLRDNLRRMRFMDHLIVRTTASFVSSPTITEERKMIFKWVGENTASRKHPSLRFVAVWYGATQVGAGTLTRWKKDDEEWTGISVDAPAEGDLGLVM